MGYFINNERTLNLHTVRAFARFKGTGSGNIKIVAGQEWLKSVSLNGQGEYTCTLADKYKGQFPHMFLIGKSHESALSYSKGGGEYSWPHGEIAVDTYNVSAGTFLLRTNTRPSLGRWSGIQSVTSNVTGDVELPKPDQMIKISSTVETPCDIIYSGTPVAGQCKLESVDGFVTWRATFAAADAVDGCRAWYTSKGSYSVDNNDILHIDVAFAIRTDNMDLT